MQRINDDTPLPTIVSFDIPIREICTELFREIEVIHAKNKVLDLPCHSHKCLMVQVYFALTQNQKYSIHLMKGKNTQTNS